MRNNHDSKAQSYTSQMVSPFTNQFQYKEKAQLLFEKLNCLNEKHQDQKYLKHQRTIEEIMKLQQLLMKNMGEKKKGYSKVLDQIAAIENQIEEQKIQANRNLLILEGCINDASRECGRMFEKMARERLQCQNGLLKFIEDKFEILLHKNQLLNNYTLHEQSLINPISYLQEIKHIKQNAINFYAKAQQEELKMVQQFNQVLNSVRQQLKLEINHQTNIEQPSISLMRELQLQINTKIDRMKSNRQKLQQNVLQMLQKLVANSIIQKKSPIQ